MEKNEPRVIDAEYRVVKWGERREPILRPYWYIKLAVMLAVLGLLTLLQLRANGHWPFDG